MRFKHVLAVVLFMVGGTLPHVTHAQDGTGIEFPVPSGPYAVGRVDVEWVDASRPELFTDDPNDVRDLLVTIYYPADVLTDAVPAPYVGTEIAAAVGLPSVLIEQMHTHVFADVPAVDATFPVLLFSPGMEMLPVFYSSLLTELTSQGYVVVAIWHPYSVAVTPYPDGRLVAINEAGIPSFADDPAAEAERVGAVWVGDMRFVLDQLPQFNIEDDRLAGRLDLERIGAFGHSFGGATSVQAAFEDERIDAAINMDGTMFGDVVAQGSRVPFLMLQSKIADTPTEAELAAAGITPEEYQAILDRYSQSVADILAKSANATGYVLEGSVHNTYTADFLVLARALPGLLTAAEIGTIDSMEAYQQIVTWVSDFMADNVMGH
ncbi:MAG: hypothetical protein K8L91_19225 [Anaerolineae bacterium]|nr:hypothetical protein [Anaerolineae bacterium]